MALSFKQFEGGHKVYRKKSSGWPDVWVYTKNNELQVEPRESDALTGVFDWNAQDFIDFGVFLSNLQNKIKEEIKT